ncbi:hypothetical protein KP509_1Z055500 [Ceratopteris richardii]|nr:hypothetical protein KP509_1Z055500 [Ceratopteris richardii]
MRKLHLEGCDGLEELLPTNQASFFGDTFFDMKKKNRAWDAETAKDLLKDETTRSALRGLSINSAVTLPYEATKYESLPRLLFLRVIDDAHGGESLHGNNFAGNVLKSLRCEELRLLVWRNAPFGELPSGFCSTNLRLLDLRSSSVCEVPPRACFIQLRYLDMAGTNISSVPHGISFDNLEHMDLSSTKIKELPSGVRCPNLRRLDLSNTEICQVPHGLYSKNLEVLRLSYTNISKVPVGQIIWVGTLKSIKQIVINHKEASLTNLLVLELGGCKGLKSPSAKFSASMTSLQHLDLSRCGGLEGLDASIGRLTHLRSLLLSQCHRLMCVPQEMTKLSSLVFLDFKRCPSLQTLSFLPTTLRRLRLMGCRSLQTINASLPNLEILSTGQCTNLKRLPTELGACMRELDLQGCDGLEEFLPTNQASFFGELSSLEHLFFGDPFFLRGCTSLETLSYLPTPLRTLSLGACNTLQTVNASLPNLQELVAGKCTNLKRLPREHGACMRKLHLEGCDGLEELLPTNQASFFGDTFFDMKKKNRAWDAETAKDLLKDETTRSALRGLSINSAVTLPYEATKYESLPRLLFLRVIDDAHGGESLHGNNFAGNVLKSLRCEELRLLVWRNAPFGELPSGFCSTNLRLLDLRSSSVCEVPPRACFIQLRYLDMAGTNISSVPHGISFDNLEHMDLSSTKIKELPSGVRCPNLRRLDLSNTEICQVPHGLYSKNLEVLRLSYTNISKVPEASLTNLLVLELGGCKGLKSPSAKFSASMTSLQHLDLSRCGGLEGLDASIGRLTHLRSLLLSQCHRLMCVPQEMTKLSSLVFLDFKRCPSLQTLSFLPTTLRRLRLMGCRSLQTINASLPNLEILSAGQCTNLKRLPTELGACMRELDLQGCDGLEEFLPTNQASFFGEPSSLEYLSFGDFFELQGCTSLETLSYLPTTLRTLRLSACSSLQNMNASLPNLQELDAAKCTNLKRLPRELGACIRRLYLQGCDGLEELLPTNQASFFGGSSYVTLPVRKLYHTILERTSLSFVF